ncbi:MAG: galactokinase [Ruminococcus sp.]|nr:galactokinase [Ruminococcus sp.]
MKTYKLSDIYTENKISFQQDRYAQAAKSFEEIFSCKSERFFSAPGRTEVGGNHTDHNLGKVLAAGVSLDVIAATLKTDDSIIEVKSAGFEKDVVDITSLDPVESEKNSSAALIRGVCCGFVDRGYKIGGFKAYTTSNVLKGSGLSSSAAFEVLIGTILSCLYNDGEVSDVEIAQIAQFAENEFFGKPSGLMDQMASSIGGFITIDFKDVKNPVINKLDFDFASSGHSLCIVDTKGNHADLTPEYAAIPVEMKSVAKLFGRSELRGVSRSQLLERVFEIREKCGDRALLRALHFVDENDRVDAEAQALTSGNFAEFLSVVNRSGDSSYKYLQNIYANKSPEEQGLSVGLYLAQSVLQGSGAARVHGGGFAGTIQAFVPDEKLSGFIDVMDKTFGEGSCHVLTVRPHGGVEVNL